MGIRPRTRFVKKLKAHRCPKCGAKLHPHVGRCRRCHQVQPRPKK